jgi:Protein of unknown function (DUF229)
MINIKLTIIFVFIYSFCLFYYYERVISWERSLSYLKYSPSNSLSTISPIYQSVSTSVTIEKEEVYTENTAYRNYSPKFSIDDTDLITNQTYYIPTNFGYSVSQGQKVFPNYTYPLCSSLVKPPSPIMTFDYDSMTFFMECETGTPYYVLEPRRNKGRLFQYDEIIGLLNKVKYTEPVTISVEEYAFGSCDGNTFNNAIHFPKLNKKILQKTTERMQELGVKNKPLIVLILTIDSYSRRHFFRKLPKTVEFLNNLSPEFAAFDFKIHNEFAESSVRNMVPVFSGDF